MERLHWQQTENPVSHIGVIKDKYFHFLKFLNWKNENNVTHGFLLCHSDVRIKQKRYMKLWGH